MATAGTTQIFDELGDVQHSVLRTLQTARCTGVKAIQNSSPQSRL